MITISSWVKGQNAIRFQNLVKRCDGRFKTNINTTDSKQYVTVTFYNFDYYRRFVSLLRVIDQPYF